MSSVVLGRGSGSETSSCTSNEDSPEGSSSVKGNSSMDSGAGGVSTCVFEVEVGSATSVTLGGGGIVTFGGEEESIPNMALGILGAVSGILFVKLRGAVGGSFGLAFGGIVTVAVGGWED